MFRPEARRTPYLETKLKPEKAYRMLQSTVAPAAPPLRQASGQQTPSPSAFR
jgi:hypothetical protein